MNFEDPSPPIANTTSWLRSPLRSATTQPSTPFPIANGTPPTGGPSRIAAGAPVASVTWTKSIAPGLKPGTYSPLKAFTLPRLRLPPFPPRVRSGSVAGSPATARTRGANPKV